MEKRGDGKVEKRNGQRKCEAYPCPLEVLGNGSPGQARG